MEIAIKVSCAGICAALLALLLKKSNAELSVCLGLAGAAVILALAFGLVDAIAEAARTARRMTGLSGAVFSPVLRCVAVGIVCSLASDACRDAGSSQLASAVDLAGAVAALFCALPLLTALLDTVEGLL